MPRPADVIQEKYFTVNEVAAQFRLDSHTIRDLFESEPGVLIFGLVETKKKARKYRQLRIPQSVLNRVIARRTVRA